MGMLCLCLVLVMVGKCCALLVPYGSLLVLCLACSLWLFVSAVPSLAPCGGLLCWFLEVFRSIFCLQVSLYLSHGSYFVSTLFCDDCFLDVGSGDDLALYKDRFLPCYFTGEFNKLILR